MQVIHARVIEDFQWDLSHPVLGMGTFDGVHLGHQEILRRVREQAARLGGTPAALTFAQHPLEVVRPEQAPPILTPLPLKLALLAGQGMAATVVIHFSRALAELEAEAFISHVLAEGLRVRALCVGYDFGFGKGRRGDVVLLEALAPRRGFRLEVVPAVRVAGLVVSSRRIRALLAEGKVEEAQELLGRPYTLEGEVQPGMGRGQKLGFPTANLRVDPRLPLRDGVYAGRVLVRGGFQDAMMNVGVAPTFGPGTRRLEIHMPGWSQALYGERVAAFFLQRLRDEARFAGAEALAAQLAKDRQAAAAAWEAARTFPWPEWTLHS
jgi:riboflavin kinase/FMN adenylyltransferase